MSLPHGTNDMSSKTSPAAKTDDGKQRLRELNSLYSAERERFYPFDMDDVKSRSDSMSSVDSAKVAPVAQGSAESQEEAVAQELDRFTRKFAASGIFFLGVVDEKLAHRQTYWTHRHTGGGEPESMRHFLNGRRYESQQKHVTCKRKLLNDDDSAFGPFVAAVGCTVYIVPDAEQESARTYVLLDRNHTEGSSVNVQGKQAATGQHLIGDLTLCVHKDTFLACQQQPAEKTAWRFEKQSQYIENIKKNYLRLGKMLRCDEWLWQLYQQHTADGTAGELLAATVTSETGKIVYISNKLACRPNAEHLFTVPGGKPKWTVRTTDKAKVAEVQSLISAACDEHWEESGLNASMMLATVKRVHSVTLLSIGDGEERVDTPYPVNLSTAAVATLVY